MKRSSTISSIFYKGTIYDTHFCPDCLADQVGSQEIAAEVIELFYEFPNEPWVVYYAALKAREASLREN